MKLIAGIELDLNFHLFEYNDLKNAQISHVEEVVNNILKGMFQDFTTYVSFSTQSGIILSNGKPCTMYYFDIMLAINDCLDIGRGGNVSSEVAKAILDHNDAHGLLRNFKLSRSESDSNENETQCTPTSFHILCPEIWRSLLISMGVSAVCFVTSLIFEDFGVSLGSFTRFEFVSFKIVHLLYDAINIGAILLACNNYALILRNTEVMLHWLSLAMYAWLCVIGHQIWRMMTYTAAPIKVSSNSFSKRSCCLLVFMSTGLIVVLSYLASFLHVDAIALSYDHGGTLYRSNFDFMKISLFLFVPQFFATVVFCISVLIASRHEQKRITNVDHWLVQNFRLLLLLSCSRA